ncbi:MAG TPA: cupin domain-containing protein, partial [Pseudonocardia sp.]|nr:cupin domain-containing protein [Pseudonocardia sp.]
REPSVIAEYRFRVREIREAGRYSVTDGAPNTYHEHFRSQDLSVGTYCIPVGGKDDQLPHSEDEIYVVVSGRGSLVADSGEVEVGPGSVVFVPALEHHRFTEITEDLTVLVMFAPPERVRS